MNASQWGKLLAEIEVKLRKEMEETDVSENGSATTFNERDRLWWSGRYAGLKFALDVIQTRRRAAERRAKARRK